MDFTRMKQLVVPEGVVKKVVIGGRTVWEAGTQFVDLGSSLTSAQSTAIRAVDFTKNPVGGYWTFSNVPYSYVNENNATVSDTYSGIMRVADCDYYLNTGDTPCTAHHVVVVPDKTMYMKKMDQKELVTGGYVGSKMYTTYLRRAKAIFNACFGENHVLSHREFLVNTVDTSDSLIKIEREIAGAWYNSTVELMDERMVFGTAKYANTSLPSVSNRQLSLFKNNSRLIASDYPYWLRNVSGNDSFAKVRNGIIGSNFMSAGNRVRPYALIY